MTAPFEVRTSAISFGCGPAQAVVPLERLEEGLAFVASQGITSIELDSEAGGTKPRQIDFGFLDRVPDLTGFECRMNVSKRSDLAPLFRQRRLRQLGWPARTTPPIDLASFPELECLSIKHQPSTSGWASLQRLRYLRLSLAGGQDLSILRPLRCLAHLEVADAAIESLGGIEDLDALETVDLFMLSRLTDISAIARCKGLKTLNVHQTRRLTDFGALAGAPALASLSLYTATDSLAFVPAMKALQTLFCNGLRCDDLSPLLRAPSLRAVDVQPRRRSHSPTVDLILRALGDRS